MTSTHGTKIFCSGIVILAVTLTATVYTYRLKKSAQISRWNKAITTYSEQLQQENLGMINAKGD